MATKSNQVIADDLFDFDRLACWEVEDIKVEFRLRAGVVKAVDGVSYNLDRGETLAIVGESGSGKTVSAQAITDRVAVMYAGKIVETGDIGPVYHQPSHPVHAGADGVPGPAGHGQKDRRR